MHRTSDVYLHAVLYMPWGCNWMRPSIEMTSAQFAATTDGNWLVNETGNSTCFAGQTALSSVSSFDLPIALISYFARVPFRLPHASWQKVYAWPDCLSLLQNIPQWRKSSRAGPLCINFLALLLPVLLWFYPSLVPLAFLLHQWYQFCLPPWISCVVPHLPWAPHFPMEYTIKLGPASGNALYLI